MGLLWNDQEKCQYRLFLSVIITGIFFIHVLRYNFSIWWPLSMDHFMLNSLCFTTVQTCIFPFCGEPKVLVLQQSFGFPSVWLFTLLLPKLFKPTCAVQKFSAVYTTVTTVVWWVTWVSWSRVEFQCCALSVRVPLNVTCCPSKAPCWVSSEPFIWGPATLHPNFLLIVSSLHLLFCD